MENKKFYFYEPIFDELPGPSLFVLYLMSFGMTEDRAIKREAELKAEGYFDSDFDDIDL